MAKKGMETVKLPDVWHEWTITEKVGQGSFGTVYKAERKIGSETFVSAIKIVEIPEDSSETETMRRELESELSVREYFRDIVDNYISEIKTMDVLKGISNVVSVEDYAVEEKQGEIGWIIYIRMEFLQSFPRYSAARKIGEQEAIRLGQDICTALSYCEQLHILHRDIKPDNIFVSPLGHFKLGDFGVARRLDKTTATYSAKGTFTYMAPEVFKGQRYGVKADIYSLGIVLYRLMNRNRDPFVEPYKQIVYYKDRDDALRRRMNGEEFPAPVEASKEFSEVILRACAYAPEDRFANAGEMLEALKRLTEGQSQLSKEQERPEAPGNEPEVIRKKKLHGKKSHKKNILLIIGALLACMVITAGTGGRRILNMIRDGAEGVPLPESPETDLERQTEPEYAAETERKQESESATEDESVAETKNETENESEREPENATETDNEAAGKSKAKQETEVHTENSETTLPAGATVTDDGDIVVDLGSCASFVFRKTEDSEVWIVVSRKKIEEALVETISDPKLAEELSEMIGEEMFIVNKDSSLQAGDVVTLAFVPDETLEKKLEECHIRVKFQRISKAFEGWE